MTKQWNQVTLEVAREEAEKWADALLEAGALSVLAEDADADSPDEQALFGEPGMHVGAQAGTQSSLPPHDAVLPFGWQRTRLAVLLDLDVDPQSLVDEVAAALAVAAPRIAEVSRIEDQDWVRTTQSQFDPIPVGERLLVVPSWHVDEVARRGERRLALIIDPGLAFGTGSHATTHLCLEWLEQADLAGRRVIDYGCGSGILAIAAARLGAAQVTAIDIDPQALVSTAENARCNEVAVDVRPSTAPLPEVADVVVANILSNPLKLLAPMLMSLVAPGGALVLSGVLERQVDEVAECYAGTLPVQAWGSRDGWVCLVGRRPT
jgi:ribosomal protein L11 methyltransferase